MSAVHFTDYCLFFISTLTIWSYSSDHHGLMQNSPKKLFQQYIFL